MLAQKDEDEQNDNSIDDEGKTVFLFFYIATFS